MGQKWFEEMTSVVLDLNPNSDIKAGSFRAIYMHKIRYLVDLIGIFINIRANGNLIQTFPVQVERTHLPPH